MPYVVISQNHVKNSSFGWNKKILQPKLTYFMQFWLIGYRWAENSS
jgi:hypothetical protein